MSILFDMKVPDHEGHVWRTLAMLADEASALLNQQGITTALVYPQVTHQRPYEIQHAEILEMPLSRKYGSQLSDLLDFLKQHQAKVLVYHDVNASEIDCNQIHRHGIITVNCSRYGFMKNETRPLISRLKNAIRKQLDLLHHDVYMANSYFQRDSLKRLTSIPDRRIVTVCNGVDSELFHPDRAITLAQAYDWPQADLIIASASQCRKQKRIEWSIRAAARLKKDRPDLDFKVLHAGTGGELEHLTAYATELGVQEQFLFIGYLNDPAALYGHADFFIHPSERESFGQVIVEAMACQIPVVCTDCGGPGGIVSPNLTGIIVDMYDEDRFYEGILRLADNPELCRNMGKASRKKIESEFTRTGQVKAYAQLLMDLHENHKTDPDSQTYLL